MGSGRRIHNAPRRCHRLLLSDERLRPVAGLNHGARRRWIRLPCRACCAWRNAKARKKIGPDKLRTGNRADCRSQYGIANDWIAHASPRVGEHVLAIANFFPSAAPKRTRETRALPKARA